jgi:hypothetical protein
METQANQQTLSLVLVKNSSNFKDLVHIQICTGYYTTFPSPHSLDVSC